MIKVNNKKVFSKVLNNVFEFIKSKFDKNYILSVNSPKFLKRNKDLILRTVRKNNKFIDYVSNDILLNELQQSFLPTNGIIYEAFKNGYLLNANPTGAPSSDLLLGTQAKNVILTYIKMQSDNLKNNHNDTLQLKLSSLIEYLNEDLLLDSNFKKQLLDLVTDAGYKISAYSSTYLKQSPILVQNYYQDLIKSCNESKLLTSNILKY